MSPIISTLANASAYGYRGFAAAALPNSYESIATLNGGGAGTVSVTFSSIPQTYTHLQLRIMARSAYPATGCASLRISVNGDGTSTNYYDTSGFYGDNGVFNKQTVAGTSGVGGDAGMTVPMNSNATFYMGASIVDIHNYSSTVKKTFSMFSGSALSNTTRDRIGLYSGSLMNTNAITSITITDSLGNGITTDSVLALYGIKEA